MDLVICCFDPGDDGCVDEPTPAASKRSARNKQSACKTPSQGACTGDSKVQGTQGTREARLNKKLKQEGLKPWSVPGDGNCQFHALVDQLTQNGVKDGDKLWTHVRLRKHLCKWLRDNQNRLMDNGEKGEKTTLMIATIGCDDDTKWDKKLNEMEKDGSWGDQTTLVAAATIFEAEVKVELRPAPLP